MSAWLPAFATGGGGVALESFACMAGAALLTLYGHPRLPQRSRDAATHEVVKLAAGMLLVLTSILLGLLATAMNAGFTSVDRDVRQFGTDLILTDRALRVYGPEAAPARDALARYTARALHGTWPADGKPGVVEDRTAGGLLDAAQQVVLALRPADPTHVALAQNAQMRLGAVLDQRWTLIAEAQNPVPTPLLAVVVGWLTLSFASLGYNAPRNAVVVATLLLSAASMAAAIFLIVDLAGPFDGLLKVSPEPVARALEAMRG